MSPGIITWESLSSSANAKNRLTEARYWNQTFRRAAVYIFKFLRFKLRDWAGNLMTTGCFPSWAYSQNHTWIKLCSTYPTVTDFILNNRRHWNHFSALIWNEMPQCTQPGWDAVILRKLKLFTTISSSTSMRPFQTTSAFLDSPNERILHYCVIFINMPLKLFL